MSHHAWSAVSVEVITIMTLNTGPGYRITQGQQHHDAQCVCQCQPFQGADLKLKFGLPGMRPCGVVVCHEVLGGERTWVRNPLLELAALQRNFFSVMFFRLLGSTTALPCAALLLSSRCMRVQ